MLHFTMTGYYAGATYCGARRNDTDRFQHAAYPGPALDRQLADPDLCTECHKVYNDVFNEDDR